MGGCTHNWRKFTSLFCSTTTSPAWKWRLSNNSPNNFRREVVSSSKNGIASRTWLFTGAFEASSAWLSDSAKTGELVPWSIGSSSRKINASTFPIQITMIHDAWGNTSTWRRDTTLSQIGPITNANCIQCNDFGDQPEFENAILWQPFSRCEVWKTKLRNSFWGEITFTTQQQATNWKNWIFRRMVFDCKSFLALRKAHNYLFEIRKKPEEKCHFMLPNWKCSNCFAARGINSRTRLEAWEEVGHKRHFFSIVDIKEFELFSMRARELSRALFASFSGSLSPHCFASVLLSEMPKKLRQMIFFVVV